MGPHDSGHASHHGLPGGHRQQRHHTTEPTTSAAAHATPGSKFGSRARPSERVNFGMLTVRCRREWLLG
eukprot:s3066_g8.t1